MKPIWRQIHFTTRETSSSAASLYRTITCVCWIDSFHHFSPPLGPGAGPVSSFLSTPHPGFAPPDSGPHMLLRILCGLAIGLAALAVVRFPDRTPGAGGSLSL
jgi:hypothetical protein